MPIVLEITNPFDPGHAALKAAVREGTSPREYLENRYGKGFEFEFPTVLKVNGVGRTRDSWGEPLVKGDCAIFERLPGLNPWVGVIVGVGSAVLLTPDVPTFNDREEPPSVYNLQGQKNAIKLGNPVPCCYGRNRQFPPYAARSYSKFKDNDQYQYSLFCIGQGYHAVEKVQIEDTDISNFQGTTYEIYQPGEDVTLFPDNIETNGEVSNIELFGPNEDEFTGYSGPFSTNSVGTETTTLEWDVVFPNGLYKLDDGGNLQPLTVSLDFEYRKIDDAGAPLGSWVTVAFSKTLATDTPQRFTVETAVPAGRYEVRAQRTNDADLSTRSQDTAKWYQLRAVLPSTKDYGSVTLLAVAARATNNLNDSSQNRVNVICTRKLPVWDGVAWSAPQATRSPVWAFVDIAKAKYGAGTSDARLALSDLLSLAAKYEARGDTFDWIFDRKTNVWDAMKVVAEAGRASSVINGTQFALVRDEARTVPVAAFAPENILEDSFAWTLRLQPDNAYDGIELEYLDHDTFKQETAICLIGDDLGVSTEKITVPGITNRDKAYQHGLYLRAKQLYRRESVQFTTGQEGEIPSFGDLVATSHDSPVWGEASGFVESIGADKRTVNLSESLSGKVGDRVAFRNKLGEVDGPYQCVIAGEYQVVTTSEISGEFLFNSTDEPPIFFFGTANTIYKLATLKEKTTDASGNVSITLQNYDERVYAFEDEVAPALGQIKLPSAVPDLPVVANVALAADIDDPALFTASWDDADGALYYVAQLSYDGVVWTDLGTVGTSHLSFVSQDSVFTFRVAGVRAGQGPWAYAENFYTRATSDGDTRATSDGSIRITTS